MRSGTVPQTQRLPGVYTSPVGVFSWQQRRCYVELQLTLTRDGGRLSTGTMNRMHAGASRNDILLKAPFEGQ
jgi:hypothetical protein